MARSRDFLNPSTLMRRQAAPCTSKVMTKSRGAEIVEILEGKANLQLRMLLAFVMARIQQALH